MHMLRVALFALLTTQLLSGCTASDTVPPADPVREAVQRVAPGYAIDSVRDAPIRGFKEVAVGAQILYVSNDGTRLIEGTIVDTRTRQDLTKPAVERRTADMLALVPEAEQIRYAPAREKLGRVFVFTDPTCPYCARLHRDLPKWREYGIEVVYLAFPRSGLQGPAYDQLTQAFCAPDRLRAMDELFAGKHVASPRCLAPVDTHYALGRRLNVAGTPAIFTADGRHIGGYLTPEQAVAALRQSQPAPADGTLVQP